MSVHCGVDVVEELVADGDCVAPGFGDERPAVVFLGRGAGGFVVAVAGVEVSVVIRDGKDSGCLQG